jgi:hypothetical protein
MPPTDARASFSRQRAQFLANPGLFPVIFVLTDPVGEPHPVPEGAGQVLHLSSAVGEKTNPGGPDQACPEELRICDDSSRILHPIFTFPW